jgi:AGZA family xanthine/uracil permease-like MFS transporter
MRQQNKIDFYQKTESAPSALTAIMMPFTYSIANGLAFGFISYALIKLLTGRASQVHAATWLVAGLFLIRFAFFVE